jgi:hypothetical protein
MSIVKTISFLTTALTLAGIVARLMSGDTPAPSRKRRRKKLV